MKFAKELDQDLVPEWRIKYLDYKAGKKHVKAVARAVNRMNATPRSADPASPLPREHSTYGAISTFPRRTKPSPRLRRSGEQNVEQSESLRDSPAPLGADSRPDSDASEEDQLGPLQKSPATPIPGHRRSAEPANDMTIGGFVPTPPNKPGSSSFELPGPALTPGDSIRAQSRGAAIPPGHNLPTAAESAVHRSSQATPTNAYEVGRTSTPSFRRGTFANLRNRFPTTPETPFLRRVLSMGAPLTPSESRRLDVDLVHVDYVRQRQREFFAWMDKELDKIEQFYKMKEDEAGARLAVLREQLHEMRNRRIEEVVAIQQAKSMRKEDERNIFQFPSGNGKAKTDDDRRPNSRDHLKAWFDPLERVIDQTKAKFTAPHPESNSKALQNMQASPDITAKSQAERNQRLDDGRDYVRRPHYSDEVPYRTAKRKLKLAMQEFYRGLELLKSYALLNRTAFRKINKKYDKAVNAHPPLRYMSEKVNKAWFVQSEVLDGHIHAVEDLYARYFERGNHKIATGKLRSSQGRRSDQSASAFRNGLLIGIGAVFTIQGIIYGAELLRHPDPTIRLQTSYLLQIYGGYFLALYLFAWFCLDCSIWTRHKINYQFVFEFDPRSHLDWQQLAEFPSFLILIFGLFIWLNFTRYGSPAMFIYYPVILIFVTAVVIFIPAPILFHRSRRWFVYSHWRLLLAGLYPVEFRDFFLGDMYCSLTYFMANIELFFCLYAHEWNNPPQCNSNHSRLLGFFSALPGVWRALQCLRRYKDTKNIFPHLVNCGKYLATILYYVTLSMYRIDRTWKHLAAFVTFAIINAIYTSIWDLLMDWSLLQPNASKRFLRDVRGYKSTHWYYLAMVLDPILRFNWIFYAIYTHDLQHSTFVSFAVALSEITRRGIWVLFRVENEHCSNVARFKASRDVPLPYAIPTESEDDTDRRQHEQEQQHPLATTTSAISPAVSRLRSHTGATLEAQVSAGSSLRHRPPRGRTFTMILADAHTQDFEKKKKPGAGDSDSPNNIQRDGDADDNGRAASSDEDDDDEQDTQDVLDAEALLAERRATNGNGNREE